MSSLAPNVREEVTSVGNAWIICRSKSLGRIYYFNTLSGEAVWNLSETEAEKAKHTTKILQHKPGFAIEDCPEPPESPTNYLTSKKQPFGNIKQFPHQMVPPKVYNKQITNNRFPTPATPCASHHSMSTSMHPIQYQIPAAPGCSSAAPGCNPAAWNIASQQIYVTPVAYSQPQPLISNNDFDHVYLNNVTNENNHFKRYSENAQKQLRVGYSPNRFRWHNKYQQNIKNPKKGKNNKLNNMDLRIHLSRKKQNLTHEKFSQLRANIHPSRIRTRRYSFSANEEGLNNDDENWLGDSNNKGGNRPLTSRIRRRSYSFCADAGGENDGDNEWIEHLTNKHSDTNHGIVSPLPSRSRSYSFSANTEGGNEYDDYCDTNQGDVSPLPSHSRSSFSVNENNDDDDDPNIMWFNENFKSQRNINQLERKALGNDLQTKESFDVWYLVADWNVFLKNINLLNDILILEKQCCLLVPKMVKSRIETETKSLCPLQAYIALCFIWQQYEVNRAIIDKKSECNDILHFCRQIIDEKRRVVLLTDDTDLNNTDASNIHIITTAKMTQWVNEGKSNETTTENSGNLQEFANVQITIENENNIQYDEGLIKSPMSKHIDTERGFEGGRRANVLHASDVLHINNACDVSVQADSVPPQTSDRIWDEIIVPDSTKGNGNSSRKINEIQPKRRICDFSSKTKNTDNVIIVRRRHTDRSTLSLANDHTGITSAGVASSSPFADSTIDDRESLTRGLAAHAAAEAPNKRGAEASDAANIGRGNPHESIIEETSISGICSTSNVDAAVQTASNVDAAVQRASNVEAAVQKASEGEVKVKESKMKGAEVKAKETKVKGAEVKAVKVKGAEVKAAKVKGAKVKEAKVKGAKADERCVMFEVRDAQMEAALLVKADEWVSRFVQIMEEVLSQLLRRAPGFALDAMPPPWSLHEAVECVRQHYRHDPDVVDAADKLLCVSRDSGGLRGKIKSNIGPHKYMELYSYGVYLIDNLQSVLSDNEDLKTAAESLFKLLNDIQNPHLDLSQDSFGDMSGHESEANVTADKGTDEAEINRAGENKETPKKSPRKSKKNQSPVLSSPGKYNLRSQTKKNTEVAQETSDSVTFVRNIDLESSFFTNLDLKKVSTNNSETETEKPQSIIGSGTNDDKHKESPSLQNMDAHINTTDETISQVLNGDPIMNEPKLIRTFSKCFDMEKKLKHKTELLGNNPLSWTYYDDEEEIGLTIDEGRLEGEDTEDYGYQDNEYQDNEYQDNEYQDDEYQDNEYYSGFNDNLWNNEYIPEEIQYLNSNLQVSKDENASTSKDVNAANKTVPFKLLMEKLETSVVTALNRIKQFCANSCRMLESEELSADSIRRIQITAKSARTYTHLICDRLQSILTRENEFSHRSIFEILNREEFAKVAVEDNDREHYIDFIGNCLEFGNILKQCVKSVIKACKVKARA